MSLKPKPPKRIDDYLHGVLCVIVDKAINYSYTDAVDVRGSFLRFRLRNWWLLDTDELIIPFKRIDSFRTENIVCKMDEE